MKTAPSVLALLASASLAAAVPVLQTREPHFGEVLQPQAGYVLFVNDSTATNDTVAFQYRNGGRYDNTTCTISLQNDTATYTLASDVLFYGSYSVNTTLNIFYSVIADGNYTLIAQELLEGQITSEVIQSFAISHNASTPAPSGSAEVVNPYAPSTSSEATVGTVYLPPAMLATQSASSDSASTTASTPEPSTIDVQAILSQLAANYTASPAASATI